MCICEYVDKRCMKKYGQVASKKIHPCVPCSPVVRKANNSLEKGRAWIL